MPEEQSEHTEERLSVDEIVKGIYSLSMELYFELLARTNNEKKAQDVTSYYLKYLSDSFRPTEEETSD